MNLRGIEFMTSGHDMKAHQSTYESFIKAATWGAGFCAVVVVIVITLLTS